MLTWDKFGVVVVIYTAPISLSRTFCSLNKLETVLLSAWTADHLKWSLVLKEINTKPESV